MQTKLLTVFCSLAFVIQLMSCKPIDGTTKTDKEKPLDTPVVTIIEKTFTSVTISWKPVENAVSYAYLIAGFAKEETSGTSVTFKDLKAGDYILRVQAIPADKSGFAKSDFANIDVTIDVNPNAISLDDLEGNWIYSAKQTLKLTLEEGMVVPELLEEEYVANVAIEKTIVIGTDENGQAVELDGIYLTGFDNIAPDSYLIGMMNKDEQTVRLYSTPITQPEEEGGRYIATIGFCTYAKDPTNFSRVSWALGVSCYDLISDGSRIAGTTISDIPLQNGRRVNFIAPLTVECDALMTYFPFEEHSILKYPAGNITLTKSAD